MINQPGPRTAPYAQSRETINPDVADATARSATTGGLYGESRHTTYVDPAGHQVENRAEVSQDKNLGRANRRSWVGNVISFLLGMLEMTLALRFVFRLLGASQGSSFTQFLYNLSQVFVAPFTGIFHDQALGTHSVFELSTLIAMLLFALLAWGLVALSRVVEGPNGSGRQRFTTSRNRRKNMYTINYSYGVARVHLAGSPLAGCQPQDKQAESGWWEIDLTTIPPEGTIIKAGDGKRYQVDYCHALSPGCMGSQ